jgi:hypothetical protein
MIVLPGRRSVGLKTAKASSRSRWCRCSFAGASSADDVGAGLSCELRHHRADCASGAVRDDALVRPKVAVLEQCLQRGEARDWQARAHCEVNVARQWREVACLDCHILRQSALAISVREAEHSLSDRQSRRAVAEGGDHSSQLVPGIDGVRSRSRRSVQVEGHASSVGTNPDA